MSNRVYNGVVIPPADLTPCGRLTASPESFYTSACAEADRLATAIGLHAGSAILDIGCGVGRLPIGLLATKHAFATYHGIDVDRTRVAWCDVNLAPQDHRLSFRFINVRNDRYNPHGAATLSLDIADSSIDIVYLYSVFSHLLQEDVENYLAIFRRILKPGGVCFTTMFVADGVPPCTENPPDFGPLQWAGRLHCVLYSRENWAAMLRAAGLAVSKTEPDVNIDGQTGYYLVHQS